ncbi:MAG TPA: tRNA (adenosine(37)-N6)-threonylcarbamoyltransferase complex dimerization subunit type 1 TsaB [Anaerolineales bacterium]|nr:tRNA (adenosine(37)-N6)-threonylcarbamoyltransferase complex dimerization subunit type 1 TsaB [Anaerolineales bacterium]
MLLAIDTSTRQIGLAVFDGAVVLAESVWTSPFHHTVELAPAAARALKEAGIAAGGLTAIGVAIGPGSFTALRTGLAFAKGLALPRELPLIGVPSLDVTAAGQPGSDLPLAAVLEAGRTRLAAGRYAWSAPAWRPSGKPELVTPDELAAGIAEPIIVCGELGPAVREALEGHPFARLSEIGRRPAVLAELAWRRFSAGERDDPDTLAPIYLSTAGLDP